MIRLPGPGDEPPYFAYGSNLEPLQMAERCPGHGVLGRAVLRDHVLRFRGHGRDWAGAVATVEPRKGSDVHGVVFSLTRADYESLDDYEGCDGPGAPGSLYDRVAKRVELEDGRTLDVQTYVMRSHPGAAPSRRYLEAILAGMRHHGLPAEAIAAVEAVETRD